MRIDGRHGRAGGRDGNNSGRWASAAAHHGHRAHGYLRVALGIDENGHLAFIDPGECDFEDPRDVRIVNLDDACRAQQVHDGAFSRVEDVPRRALSLTIPFFLRTPHAVVTVPGPAKARAVRAALEGPVSPRCPASILRQHPGAAIFLDTDSAALLTT
jgi:glucosamine-6-phosphate deaminase